MVIVVTCAVLTHLHCQQLIRVHSHSLLICILFAYDMTVYLVSVKIIQSYALYSWIIEKCSDISLNALYESVCLSYSGKVILCQSYALVNVYMRHALAILGEGCVGQSIK